ncbi:hypothetical protein MN0502_13030 [Arthrobacter sp. MN05-02]|nr:hypothetical protein MN0502_13030 [Arthrobacter sp. MN05-02]
MRDGHDTGGSGHNRRLHAASLADPEAFWLEAARAVDRSAPPVAALDASATPLHRWFPDAPPTTSRTVLHRHVAADGGRRAHAVPSATEDPADLAVLEPLLRPVPAETPG